MTQVPRVPQYDAYFPSKLPPSECQSMRDKCSSRLNTKIRHPKSNHVSTIENAQDSFFCPLWQTILITWFLIHNNLATVVYRNYFLDYPRRGLSLEPVAAKLLTVTSVLKIPGN